MTWVMKSLLKLDELGPIDGLKISCDNSSLVPGTHSTSLECPVPWKWPRRTWDDSTPIPCHVAPVAGLEWTWGEFHSRSWRECLQYLHEPLELELKLPPWDSHRFSSHCYLSHLSWTIFSIYARVKLPRYSGMGYLHRNPLSLRDFIPAELEIPIFSSPYLSSLKILSSSIISRRWLQVSSFMQFKSVTITLKWR